MAAFALAIWDGRRRGFAVHAVELVSVCFALAAALLLFRPAAMLLHRAGGVPMGLGGFGCFIALLVVGHGLASGAGRRLLAALTRRRPGLRISPAAGAAPALGTALAISALALSGLVVLPQAAPSRTLVLGSALGGAITHGSRFLQPPLQALIVAAPSDSQGVIDPNQSTDAGEDAFYHLTFPPDLQVEPDVQAERRMFQLVNAARVKANLTSLVPDQQLQEAARAHSKDMYLRHYFSHLTPDRKSPFDRLRDQGLKFVSAGENIAFGQEVESAQASLMQSPDHRANIMNPDFRRVGIGIYRGVGGYGEMYTQDFADY